MEVNGYEIKPRADLREADLRGADLRGANLYGADLRGANLYGADLREAPGVIDGGLDRRGYRFLGFPQADGGLHIMAGCRYFETIRRAGQHWAGRHHENPALHAECLGRLRLIEIIHSANERNKS